MPSFGREKLPKEGCFFCIFALKINEQYKILEGRGRNKRRAVGENFPGSVR